MANNLEVAQAILDKLNTDITTLNSDDIAKLSLAADTLRAGGNLDQVLLVTVTDFLTDINADVTNAVSSLQSAETAVQTAATTVRRLPTIQPATFWTNLANDEPWITSNSLANKFNYHQLYLLAGKYNWRFYYVGDGVNSWIYLSDGSGNTSTFDFDQAYTSATGYNLKSIVGHIILQQGNILFLTTSEDTSGDSENGISKINLLEFDYGDKVLTLKGSLSLATDPAEELNLSWLHFNINNAAPSANMYDNKFCGWYDDIGDECHFMMAGGFYFKWKFTTSELLHVGQQTFLDDTVTPKYSWYSYMTRDRTLAVVDINTKDNDGYQTSSTAFRLIRGGQTRVVEVSESQMVNFPTTYRNSIFFNVLEEYDAVEIFKRPTPYISQQSRLVNRTSLDAFFTAMADGAGLPAGQLPESGAFTPHMQHVGMRWGKTGQTFASNTDYYNDPAYYRQYWAQGDDVRVFDGPVNTNPVGDTLVMGIYCADCDLAAGAYVAHFGFLNASTDISSTMDPLVDGNYDVIMNCNTQQVLTRGNVESLAGGAANAGAVHFTAAFNVVTRLLRLYSGNNLVHSETLTGTHVPKLVTTGGGANWMYLYGQNQFGNTGIVGLTDGSTDTLWWRNRYV